MNRFVALFSVVVLVGVLPLLAGAQAPGGPWAEAIGNFARQDEQSPYPQGGIVLVGSSSIRLWDLAKSFPTLDPPPLNRGFGGSQVSDSVDHAQRLVLRHRPRLVLMYAGDNDIAVGKSAEQVSRDFDKFAGIVFEELPETRLAYIAIKPSLARWELAPKMEQANAMIRQTCEKEERLTYIDIWRPMLGEDGRPRKELFREDGLHLNDEGYRVWSRVVLPVLVED